MKLNIPVFYATLAALIMLCPGAYAVAAKNRIAHPLKAVSGLWYTEGREGGIELYPCGNEICGRFQWMSDEDPNDISRDKHNSDPNLRGRPLCHLQFMGNFTPDGKGHYFDGWIYNPRDGQIYSAQMTLVDSDTLDLHGYLFFPIFGESQTWKRAKYMPSCAAAD